MSFLRFPDKLQRQRARLIRSSWSRMRRLDSRRIPAVDDEIRLFCLLRNEELRLPYFLEHHRQMGVERFIVIDNMSTDASLEILMNAPDVHIFQTDEHFSAHGVWQNVLLTKFGMNRWSVVADIDELVMYPYMEQAPLRTLTRYFDDRGFTAMHAVLVDLYSDNPTKEVPCAHSLNPFEMTPFFDPPDFEERDYRSPRPETVPERILCGGTRRRIFGVDICSSKIPMMRFTRGMHLNQGHHSIERARLADLRGAVMHLSFLNDSIDKARVEAARGVHWQEAVVYKQFTKVFNEQGDVRPYHDRSLRFIDTAQLVNEGVMQVSRDYTDYLAAVRQADVE